MDLDAEELTQMEWLDTQAMLWFAGRCWWFPGRQIMSRIRSKDTRPELRVRRTLHAMGYRFRLHVRSLPGCPDIVLPKHSVALQVRGCFWHLHRCMKRRLPKTNTGFWLPKLRGNRARDIKNDRKLRRLGWKVRTIWECELDRMAASELRALLRGLFMRCSRRRPMEGA